MHRKKIVLWSICFIVASLMMFSLTPAKAAEPKRGGTLVVLISQVFGFDIHKEVVGGSMECLSNIFSTLVRYDEKGGIAPELAKSWDISPDGKVYTFKLHDNVYFHNGRKMTSTDVKYSIERMLNPDTGSARIDTLWLITKIEIPDEQTVRFTLSQPFVPFLAYLANEWVGIVAKENVEDGRINSHPVGTGPFMFKKQVTGNYILLEKNPKYFKAGLPYLDALKYQIVIESTAAVAAFRSKKADATAVWDGASERLFKRVKGLKWVKTPPLSFATMFFNHTNPIYNNPKVRLAISYAIDRQEQIDAGSLGFGIVTAPIPEGLPGYAVPVEALSGYQHNIKKAKALLREAGDSDGLTLKLLTCSDFQYYLSHCQFIQSQLKEIGINVEIISLEWGAFIQTLFGAEGYDAFFLDFQVLPLDPDIYVYRIFHSQGLWNARKFSDPKVDELLEKGRLAVDVEQRKKIYRDLQFRLTEIAAAIWLYRLEVNYISQSWVEGTIYPPTIPAYDRAWLNK